MLLAKCYAVGLDWGMTEVFAHVEESNEAARLLYQRAGFSESGGHVLL